MAGREYSEVMALRVRPSQRTLFEAAANAEGLSLSSWMRQTLHAAARERFRELLWEADPGTVEGNATEGAAQKRERFREALEAKQ